jgi:hypothetical protein
MVATRVLPSPVAISAILPWCKAMPPINWTSNGIISHRIGMATHDDVAAHQPAAGVLDCGEGFGQQVIERCSQSSVILDGGELSFQAIDFACNSSSRQRIDTLASISLIRVVPVAASGAVRGHSSSRRFF